MEEIEWGRLPDSEQVSDDFELFRDDKSFYVVRAKSNGEKLSFCLEAKSKDHAVAKAVNAIAFYLEKQPPEKVSFIPEGMVPMYVKAE